MKKVASIPPLMIGSVKIWPPVLAAPMAGYSNPATRLLYREAGAGLCVTEMVSAQGLASRLKATMVRLQILPNEKPVSIQIFGGDPVKMAEGARIIEAESEASMIDINMGCPVKKVTSTGYGVALMSDPKRAMEIVSSMKKASQLPITVKIRTGPKDEEPNCLEFARLMEQAGADAICLHPRSQSQKFTGQSQWEWISELTQSLKIPVIGNGDVLSPEDAFSMFQTTGCQGIMIGRGAVGNPFLFTQIADLFEGRQPTAPKNEKRAQMALKHFRYEITHSRKPEHEFRRVRKGLPSYFTYHQSFEAIREKIIACESNEELLNCLRSFLKAQ